MLIFASHRFRNRIIKTPEAAITMIMMAPALMASRLIWHAPCLPSTRARQKARMLPEASQ